MIEIDSKKYPYCYSGYQYAMDTVSGEISNCVYIVGACNRFLKDLRKTQDPEYPYTFSFEIAERYLRLVQKFEHVIGDNWKTKNIQYMPWQNFLWMNILGFRLRSDPKNPKFRMAHIEVPRGCSKSTMASQCALYFIGLDESLAGSKIAAFASKHDQARIVLDASRAMAIKNTGYTKSTGVRVLSHKIIHPKTFSEMVSMSSDSKSMDGLNLKLAICDELHAMSRELFDVVISGMKKRGDSLTLCITTAGFNTDGVGHAQSFYAKKVAIGDVIDEQFFSAVYTIDEGDDIFSKETWKKANPNFGISVDELAFEAAANKAKEVHSDIPNFKVKMLNIWLSEANAFFNMSAWDMCADGSLKLEDFLGQKCTLGLDLASKIDLTSIGYVFHKDGIYYIFDKSYIPEKTVKEARSALYDECISKGFLISTPGEAIHYPDISKEILDSSKKFKVSEILYDPWSATHLSQELTKSRINMVEFRFNTSNLSEPTKNLDALIRQGKIRHNGSPLLRWAFSNVVCKVDAADNVFPKKSNEKLKIDPAIAIIMAIASELQHEKKVSVYESRGLRIL